MEGFHFAFSLAAPAQEFLRPVTYFKAPGGTSFFYLLESLVTKLT